MSQPGAFSFSCFVFWLQSLSCPVCPWTDSGPQGPWDLQPFVFNLPGGWTHSWQPGALDVNVSLGIWTGGEASSQGKYIRACKLNTGSFLYCPQVAWHLWFTQIPSRPLSCWLDLSSSWCLVSWDWIHRSLGSCFLPSVHCCFLQILLGHIFLSCV